MLRHDQTFLGSLRPVPSTTGQAATALLEVDPVTQDRPISPPAALVMQTDQYRSKVAGCGVHTVELRRHPERHTTIGQPFPTMKPATDQVDAR